MSRVADKSNQAALDFALHKAKSRMEDLQLKGSGIKRIIRPSDDPPGNIELMQLRTRNSNLGQYVKNANMSLIFSELTEESLSELTEILIKAKEIAVAQASSLYNPAVRRSVSEEVEQLGKQMLGVANRHIGNRYLFAGYKNETRPFNQDNSYNGDNGIIFLEINKDFFVPVNIPGSEVFYQGTKIKDLDSDPLNSLSIDEHSKTNEIHILDEGILKDNIKEKSKVVTGKNSSEPVIEDSSGPIKLPEQRDNESLFGLIKSLVNGLRTNDNDLVQDLLERLDSAIDRTITLRTKIGSNINTIRSTINTHDTDQQSISARKSTLEDADVAELFTDITKQDGVLKAVYKTGAQTINHNLLDFLR